MKHRLLMASLLLSLVIAGPGGARAACTLNLGWEPFEPFQQKDAGGAVTGIDVDLFLAAAADAGCTVVPKEVPWQRLLGDIQEGRMDAALGASINPERQAFATFSESYRLDEFVLFVRKGEAGKIGADGVAGILGKPVKIGTVNGYEYGDAFDALAKDPAFARQIEKASGTELNVRKLVNNRLDGFIENRFVAAALIKKEGAADKLEVHPKPVSADPVYFMFSKKTVDPAIVAAINAALAKIKSDGRYEQITAKYLK